MSTTEPARERGHRLGRQARMFARERERRFEDFASAHGWRRSDAALCFRVVAGLRCVRHSASRSGQRCVCEKYNVGGGVFDHPHM